MVVKQEPTPAELNGLAIVQTLADPVRLEIVRQLAACPGGGELGCSAIEVPVKKSTASHHYKALLTAGVIAERGEGTRKYFHLRRAELDERFPGLLDSILRATAA